MTFYKNSDHFQSILTVLFDRLQQNEAAMAPLRKSKMIIRLGFTQPVAEVFVNARKTPVEVVYGKGPVRPLLDIELPAFTFHQILSDETTLVKALGQKKLIVKGPMMKALALGELFDQGRVIYPEILRESG